MRPRPPRMENKCKITRRAFRVGDKWETSVKTRGPGRPERETSVGGKWKTNVKNDFTFESVRRNESVHQCWMISFGYNSWELLCWKAFVLRTYVLKSICLEAFALRLLCAEKHMCWKAFGLRSICAEKHLRWETYVLKSICAEKHLQLKQCNLQGLIGHLSVTTSWSHTSQLHHICAIPCLGWQIFGGNSQYSRKLDF